VLGFGKGLRKHTLGVRAGNSSSFMNCLGGAVISHLKIICVTPKGIKHLGNEATKIVVRFKIYCIILYPSGKTLESFLAY
jgi:hypothetical protein